MKTSIFNFLVLQVVVWTIVFSNNTNSRQNDIQHSSFSDTWEAINIEKYNGHFEASHYPIFFKLTLNNDGSYIRTTKDEKIEDGKWNINKSKSKLILVNDFETIKYDIVKLPHPDSETFIIKENTWDYSQKQFVEYRLSRM